MAVQAGLLVASVGLSVAANALMREKGKSPYPGDHTETLGQRGSMVPLLIGRDRLAPFVGKLGKRTKRDEGASDRKGVAGSILGADLDVQIYYQPAWHVLCVGPARALYGITQAQRPIFQEVLTRETHPSGTVVDLGEEGSFAIYWGETDQPLNTELAALLGHNSVHPYCCYIWWIRKRLGQVPQWQQMEYDIEVDPYQSGLALSAPSMSKVEVLSGTTFPVERTRLEGNPLSEDYHWRILIDGQHLNRFRAGTRFRLTGNAAPDGDYIVESVKYLKGGDLTRIYVQDFVPESSNDEGTLEPYDITRHRGANAAHAIYQMVTSHWPHGAGFDPALLNLDDLETIGALLEEESLPMKVTAQQGETVEGLMGALLQDAGVAMPFEDGKLRFLPLREPTGTVPVLEDDVILPPLPEVKQTFIPIGRSAVNRLVFEYRDRERNFKKMPVTIDEDGSAELLKSRKQRTVQLETVNSHPAAVKVAERRSQEDLAAGVANNFNANREAAWLLPGQPLDVNGFHDTLRILKVAYPDSLSARVVVTAATDVYGVPASEFEPDPGGGFPVVPTPPDDDFANAVVEVPGSLNPDQIRIWTPRLRGNDDMGAAVVHISTDDTTYTPIGSARSIQAGGFLDGAFAADGWFIEEGPTFVSANDDILDVPDLTGDDANWFAGRLMVIIGDEIAFCRKVTAITGETWRIDGLIRARFDTERAAHAADTPVFIFVNTAIDAITDLLMAPDTSLYFKIQPVSNSNQAVPLTDLSPIHLNPMRGKGIVPMNPTGFVTQRLRGRRNVFLSGTHVELSWGWRDQHDTGAGAGMQAAGTPVAFPELQGAFTLEFWSTTGSPTEPERTVSGLTTKGPDGDFVYTYADASRGADFPGDTEFEVHLRHVVGSYASEDITILVQEIT